MRSAHRLARLLCVLLAGACALQPCMAWAEGAGGGATGPLKRLRSTLPGELGAHHLSVLGLQVGNDGLEAVRGRVGRAVAFSPDTAPELLTTCFVDAGDQSLAVMFQAQRRDPYRRVTMAYIGGPDALDRSVRRCQPMSGLAQAATTASGLYLGMSREAFAEQFPHAPSEETGRLLGYYFFQPLQGGRCQLLSGVRAEFDGHGLAAVTVYRLYRGMGC